MASIILWSSVIFYLVIYNIVCVHLHHAAFCQFLYLNENVIVIIIINICYYYY